MKSILITGARGFIGRHCLQFLKQNNFKIHAITSCNPNDIDLTTDAQIDWHQVNLLDRNAVSSLFEDLKPSHLMHFGWYTEHGKYWQAAENLEWVSASLHLVREFQRNGGKRFVGAGTCAEYDWKYGYCDEEVTPLKPDSLYGKSKNAVFNILQKYSQLNDLSFAWGRIFFVYGPYEKDSRLIAYVITSLLDGETANCSHGRQLRDFMYVEDVANAFTTLMESNVEGAVNIATGKPLPLSDIIELIGSKLGQNEMIQFSKYTTEDNKVPLLTGSTKKLERELKWQPSYTLSAGIDKTIEWWKKELMKVD